MTRMTTLAFGIALFGAPVLAQGITLPPDPDGNGNWSAEELRAVIPELTDEAFAAADADGDGMVNPDELQAAVAAGTLTLPG